MLKVTTRLPKHITHTLGVASLQSRRSFFELPFLLSSGDYKEISHKVVRTIRSTPEQMFNVAADIEKYQEFIPFVVKSFVNKKDPETKMPLEAGLRVGWQHFDEEFVCKIHTVQNKRLVAESITTLLFKFLYNEWTFKEVNSPFTKGPMCEVELTLKFWFNNPIYNHATSAVLEKITAMMIRTFEDRAKQLAFEKKLGHKGYKAKKNIDV